MPGKSKNIKQKLNEKKKKKRDRYLEFDILKKSRFLEFSIKKSDFWNQARFQEFGFKIAGLATLLNPMYLYCK